MMKKLYLILKIILCSSIGTFIGSSIYKYYDYKKYTDLYEMQSAPWYLSIEVNAIFTIIVVVLLFAAMRIIRKKL